MMTSPQNSPPPPYQATTTATMANNHNSSHGAASFSVNTDLKKALEDFKVYKQSLGLCITHAITCICCYVLLLIFAPLQEMARDLLGIQDLSCWSLAFIAVLLSVPCLMTIYGVFENRPGWLIPFIEVQLGGGVLLFCSFLWWFIDGMVNRPGWWLKANKDGFSDAWLIGIFGFYTIVSLYLNIAVQFCFWVALCGMIKFPASIHAMALNMFGKSTTDLMADSALLAELQVWQRRMKNSN